MMQGMRPGAEEYVGNYVRAIHEFKSGLAREIDLFKGDIFRVTEVVDNNWLRGKNKDREGNFPRDYVEKISLPRVEGDQKLFGVTDNFPAQQDGDLEFRKGEVILGLYPIDEFWWQGQASGRTGIFPSTHVIELEVPLLLKQRSLSVHSSEPLFAQALVDAVAQLDEELGFKAGDIITVTEVLDADWYIGECHGKSGMFLASCVTLLNEEECKSSPGKPVNHSYLNSQKKSDENSLSRPLSIHEQYMPNDHYSNDKANEVPDPSDHVHEPSRSISFTAENTKAHKDSDEGVTPYARTLYPFCGELPDELSFNAHDIVTLIQHVDEQWIEGELNGKIGVFPANYVEIVVDCPYAYFSDSQRDLQADLAAESVPPEISVNVEQVTDAVPKATNDAEGLKSVDRSDTRSDNKQRTESDPDNAQLDETFALVLYSFKAEMDQDLDLIEGETLTVIKKIDDNWLYVKNESGKQGMCPCTFVEVIRVIPEIPETTKTVHDANDNEVATSLEVHHHKADEFNTPKASVLSENKQFPKSSEGQSPSVSSSSNRPTSVKPGIKPKPALAPKPALKPKPPVSPKPWSKPGFKLVQFNGKSNIPKSLSTQGLSDNTLEADDTKFNSHMTKAQSMFEISKSEAVSSTSLADSALSDSGSNSSLTVSASSPTAVTSDTNVNPSQKSFQNWDMTKPLDSLLKSEFDKAREDAQKKLQGVTSGPPAKTKQTDSLLESQTSTARPASTANYSRSVFEEEVTIGNSVFFLNDNHDDFVAPKVQQLRKPPQPPLVRSLSQQQNEFNRRPSLKKPAPKRPVGPRVAPLPSKTPLIPTRTIPPRQASTNHMPPTGVPARPAGQLPRKHARPAPPRPKPAKPDTDNLMRFSPPPNTSLGSDVAEEQDPEVVLELRSRVNELQAEIETLKKSKSELKLMQQNAPDDRVPEIHDNIEFYEDNIRGLTEELKSLKAQLAEHCPKEKSKQEVERAEEQRQIEEQKRREAEKKLLEVQKMERREKREKVIQELIQTEKGFITSLHLVMETFISSSVKKHPEVDLELLFGNIEEVADVSQQLYTKLEDATNGKDFSQQVIGTCFVSLSEDMKNVYAPYCRNHDDVITLIEKYNQNENIKTYLEARLDVLREQHVVFDLEALLIKPVQRVLKYPLLLNELIKSTEDDHPDKQELLAGVTAMTDVATAINEYKRRKDLVYKYKKKETDVSLGDKLSKLSLHSLKKKSSRMKERFSANLGFIDQTRDPQFEKEETKYRHLEKTIKLFVRDVQNFIEELREGVNSLEALSTDIEDYYGEKGGEDVERLQAFQNKIHITFLPNFQIEVDELVLMPLSQLGQMFEGPNKVIQKRYDKLLDYDNMKRKAQSDKTLEKALQTAKQTYEALNDQLLDELPRLYTLSFQLLRDCVGSFVRAQREFTNKVLLDVYAILDLKLLHETNVLEMFNIQHTATVDRLASLTFMPRTFSPRVADQKLDKKAKRMSLDTSALRTMEAVPQSESQRVFVLQQYPSNKMFKITETHIATDALDISLCAGDVVGVIMEKDPMGNKEKWFVDNGVTKGFILKRFLGPYETGPNPVIATPPGSRHLLQPSSPAPHSSPSRSPTVTGNYQPASPSEILHNVEEEDMDFALDEDMTPEVAEGHDEPEGALGHGYDNQTFSHDRDSGDIEFYYAEFPFEARNENEVSLFEHQVVTVHNKCDQNGNSEWWFVDADGCHGYAPAAYLLKMDGHNGPS